MREGTRPGGANSGVTGYVACEAVPIVVAMSQHCENAGPSQIRVARWWTGKQIHGQIAGYGRIVFAAFPHV
jgi:hypothetical protein